MATDAGSVGNVGMLQLGVQRGYVSCDSPSRIEPDLIGKLGITRRYRIGARKDSENRATLDMLAYGMLNIDSQVAPCHQQ